jgi:hypothetical protein
MYSCYCSYVSKENKINQFFLLFQKIKEKRNGKLHQTSSWKKKKKSENYDERGRYFFIKFAGSTDPIPANNNPPPPITASLSLSSQDLSHKEKEKKEEEKLLRFIP